MKKYGILFFIIYFALINYSCNNTFDPNAPFRERYALTGIMRSDTTLQIVTLSRSYEPGDGYNPLTNTQDPAILGAEVNLWYRDTLYPMRDTTIARVDTSRYKDSVHCYYVNNLIPEEDQYVDIEALLPNGRLLQSSTKLPLVNPYNFFDQNSDKTIPPTSKDFIYVSWASQPGIIYSPRIYITYYPIGSTKEMEWQVPLFFVNESGKQVPVFSNQSKTTFVNVDMGTIAQYLNEIPQGGNKKDYSIAGLKVEVVVYDLNLSTYYLSLQTGQNAFTVRLDNPDFTNIQGGYGIFASYVRTDFKLKFTYDYLKAMGFE